MKRFRIIVAGAFVISLAISGCSSNESGPSATSATQSPQPPAMTIPPNWTPEAIPHGAPGVPAGGLPDATTVDHNDPDAVAIAALSTMFSMDTAIDLSPSDAGRRATIWLSPELAEDANAGSRQGGGTSWLEMESHDGYTIVTSVFDVSEAGASPDSPTQVERIYDVTYAPTGRDGWVGPPVTVAFYLALARASAELPWRVDSLTAV